MIQRNIDHDTVLEYDITGLPYILHQKYIENHVEEFQMMVQSVSKREIIDELTELRRLLKRPIVSIQKYAKTKHAAAYIDVDPSFLDKKRREGLFILGIHYYKPKNTSIVLWDLGALENWIRTEEVADDNNQIIDNMFA